MSGQVEVERLAAENAELRAALIERREGLVGMDHAGTVDLDVCLVCRRSAAPGSDIDHRPSCLLARPAAAQDGEGAAMGEINDVDDLRGMLPYEIVGEVKRLADALPDPGKLVALADWLDLKYPEEMGTGEVQADLRTWAYRAAAALGMDSIKRPDVLSTDEKIDALTTERDAATARAEALREALRQALRDAMDLLGGGGVRPYADGTPCFCERPRFRDDADHEPACEDVHALLGPEAPPTGREGE